jgi:hypothetical protein
MAIAAQYIAFSELDTSDRTQDVGIANPAEDRSTNRTHYFVSHKFSLNQFSSVKENMVLSPDFWRYQRWRQSSVQFSGHFRDDPGGGRQGGGDGESR